MKNLIIVTIMMLLTSCSKQETPQPIVAIPNPTPIQSTVCDAVYLYEVILDNPLASGDRLDVIWTDIDNQLSGYAAITTAMVLDTAVNITSSYNILSIQLSVGLIGGNPNLTIQNGVTLNIYKDNVLVATSGGSQQLCFKGTTSSTSCVTILNTLDLVYVCQ